ERKDTSQSQLVLKSSISKTPPRVNLTMRRLHVFELDFRLSIGFRSELREGDQIRSDQIEINLLKLFK
ncbi:hypothetical protein TorRG33x02_174100, partial [Trema orientale]